MHAHTSVEVLELGTSAAAAAAAAIGDSSGAEAESSWATATRGANAVPDAPTGAVGATESAAATDATEVGGATTATCSAGVAVARDAGLPAVGRAPGRNAGEYMVAAAGGASPASAGVPTLGVVDSARDATAGPLRAFVVGDATATAPTLPATADAAAAEAAVSTTLCTAHAMLGSDARRRADGIAEHSHSATWAEDSVPDVSINPRTCESNAPLMTTPAMSASTS